MFVCGKCMKEKKEKLEDRKAMALSMQEGENVCTSCDRVLIKLNGWYRLDLEKEQGSVLN